MRGVSVSVEIRARAAGLRLGLLAAQIEVERLAGTAPPVVRCMEDELSTENRAAHAMVAVRAACRRRLAGRLNARDVLYEHGDPREMERRGC